MKTFAVIRTRGGAYQDSVPLEGQREWVAHARFMNDLHAKGAIVLGGPLEGTADVLLIMSAETAEEAARYLQDDPWTSLNLLTIKEVSPWTLRLGALPDFPTER